MHRFIAAVGRGQKRARELTRDEAREAMGLIADRQADPLQVGAFLIGLRMKGEAAAELAGFVDALDARAVRAQAPAGTLDVDCHGDGHAGRATLLPAAAAAAAALGVPVVLRAELDSPKARHGLLSTLTALGVDRARPLDAARAAAALAGHKLAVIDLPAYSAPLARLTALRPLLGLRSVAQTLCKLIDPVRAETRLVGVFHAPYLPQAAGALAALGHTRSLCVQALGGLPEPPPGKLTRVAWAGHDPETLDLRALAKHVGADEAAPEDAPAANRAALAGEEPFAGRAAAACALMLHVAKGLDVSAAVAAARAALADGRASAAAQGFAG